MNTHIEQGYWLNQPKEWTVNRDQIMIRTEGGTDYWQRTYYGFSVHNAPALVMKTSNPFFSFVVKADYNTRRRYDQCGVILFQNEDYWFKASVEYENEVYQRLGSVVTNHGYSDWATTDIAAGIQSMYYRLSRRQSDYCIEYSYDGLAYKQMRIFHLFQAAEEIQFGVYACSPENSSFDAVFTEMELTDCKWEAHK